MDDSQIVDALTPLRKEHENVALSLTCLLDDSDALHLLYKQTKNTNNVTRGFICMGPNHKVKLGGNVSSQIGTE